MFLMSLYIIFAKFIPLVQYIKVSLNSYLMQKQTIQGTFGHELQFVTTLLNIQSTPRDHINLLSGSVLCGYVCT